jgi:hypothetical protein
MMTAVLDADSWERRLNPILVRSIRQSLRSPLFLGFYLLTVAIAGFCVVWCVMITPDPPSSSKMTPFLLLMSEGNAGLRLFIFLLPIWFLMACIGNLFMGFRSIRAEIRPDLWELTRLTGLSSHQIVKGLLLTGLVRALILSCALIPFLAISYVMRGIALNTLLGSLLIIPAIAGSMTAAGMFAGVWYQLRNEDRLSMLFMLAMGTFALALCGVFLGLGIGALMTWLGIPTWLISVGITWMLAGLAALGLFSLTESILGMPTVWTKP